MTALQCNVKRFCFFKNTSREIKETPDWDAAGTNNSSSAAVKGLELNPGLFICVRERARKHVTCVKAVSCFYLYFVSI